MKVGGWGGEGKRFLRRLYGLGEVTQSLTEVA